MLASSSSDSANENDSQCRSNLAPPPTNLSQRSLTFSINSQRHTICRVVLGIPIEQDPPDFSPTFSPVVLFGGRRRRRSRISIRLDSRRRRFLFLWPLPLHQALPIPTAKLAPPCAFFTQPLVQLENPPHIGLVILLVLRVDGLEFSGCT